MKKLIILFLLSWSIIYAGEYDDRIKIKKYNKKIKYSYTVKGKTVYKTSNLFMMIKKNWLEEETIYKAIYVKTGCKVFYLCFGYHRCLILIPSPDQQLCIYDFFSYNMYLNKKKNLIIELNEKGFEIIFEIIRS